MTKRKENPIPNTGRKDGPATRKTRKFADSWASSGRKMPLEIMADNMDHWLARASELHEEAMDIDTSSLKEGSKKWREAAGKQFRLLNLADGYRKQAHAAAVDCAPYIHAKLQAIKIGNEDDEPFRVIIQGPDARL